MAVLEALHLLAQRLLLGRDARDLRVQRVTLRLCSHVCVQAAQNGALDKRRTRTEFGLEVVLDLLVLGVVVQELGVRLGHVLEECLHR